MNIKDMRLWRWFSQSVTPLGQPEPPSPKDQSCAGAFISRLDLHGLTVQGAFLETKIYIAAAKRQAVDSVVVVTGKSGTIRDEFPHWISAIDGVRCCETLSGDGAFRVRFK